MSEANEQGAIEDVWARQMEALREATVEKTFAGFPVEARRIPIGAFLKAGALPQPLVEHMLKLDSDAEYKAEIEVDATKRADDLRYRLHFQRAIVEAVIKRPRFVFDDVVALKPGEVRYSGFVLVCPAFVDEVVKWVNSGCPDVPVKLAGGGEVTHEDLTHFSDDERSGERDDAGRDGEDMRSEAVEAVGDPG